VQVRVQEQVLVLVLVLKPELEEDHLRNSQIVELILRRFGCVLLRGTREGTSLLIFLHLFIYYINSCIAERHARGEESWEAVQVREQEQEQVRGLEARAREESWAAALACLVSRGSELASLLRSLMLRSIY